MIKKRKKTGPKGEMKLTPDRVKKLQEAFAIDASIPEACYYADITKQTYYNWKKRHPELFDSFERLRERPVLAARQTVVKNLPKNPDLAMRYLERKRKKEFAPRSIVDNTLLTGEMTPEMRKRAMNILQDFGEDD